MKSMLTGMRRTRTGLAAGLVLLALTGTVAGCSSDDASPEPIEGANSAPPGSDEGPDEDDEDTKDAADNAAVERLYQEYWDARVELENSPEVEFSVFDGITTETVVQQEGTRLQQFREDGIHRQGEPVITDVTVEVNGDTARIESCKSEDAWQVLQDGEVLPNAVPDELREPHPFLMAAERTADGWLISRTLPQEEATITCP